MKNKYKTNKTIGKKENTTQTSHRKLYIESFKGINKNVLMTALLDFAYLILLCMFLFCFFLILHAVLTPAAYAMQSILGLFTTIPLSGEMSTIAETTLEQNFLTLQWFYIKGFILAISAVLFLFLITSLYKAHIWMHLSSRKHTFKFIFKFIYTSMLWQILWLIVAIIIFLVFTPGFVAFFLIVELLLYVYFTPFIRMRFTENHSLIEIYKETFIVGVTKFKRFIIPVALIFVTTVFSLCILLILAGIIPLLLLAIPFFILLIIVWVRFYFAVVAKKVGV